MVKNLKKSSSPEPTDWWPWNLVCSIVYASTTKFVQIMTQGWPWLILRHLGSCLRWYFLLMLNFANWWLFAVFAISRVVCGKKWRISKETVKNTKTDLQNIRIVLLETVFIFSITAFWNFAKKLGRYYTLMQLVLYTNELGHMTNMAAMYGRKWKLLIFLETIAALRLKLLEKFN